MRSVTVRLEDLKTLVLCLGYVGENEHTRVTFDAMKMYAQYPNASVSLTVQPPEGESYPAVIERDGDTVIWDITDSDLTAEGQGEYQLGFTDEPHVARTYVGKFRVKRSIIPTGDIPTGLDDFITRAGAALTAIPETIDEALEEAKESGEFDGEDGVGIQSIEKTGSAGLVDTYTITLTDGRTYGFNVKNGKDGEDGDDGVGISSILKTGTSGLVDTYTITYTNGQTATFNVTNGAKGDPGDDYVLTEEDKEEIAEEAAKKVDLSELEEDVSELKSAIDAKADEPTGTKAAGKIYALAEVNGEVVPVWITPVSAVEDVQVNDVSVVDANGVAKIPVAGTSTPGVVAVGSGLWISSSNKKISIDRAVASQIKAGTNESAPIVPNNQHLSTFYGLAKAAGSDENNSALSAGQYTDAAKAAIQQMLDVPANNDIAYVETSLVAQRAYIPGEYFVDPSGILSKATDSISSGGSLVLDTNYKRIGGQGGLANDMLAKVELVGEVTLTDSDIPPEKSTISIPLLKPCRFLAIYISNGGSNLPPWSYIRINYANSSPIIREYTTGSYKRSAVFIDLTNKFAVALTKPANDNYPGAGQINFVIPQDNSQIITNDVATEVGFETNDKSTYASGFNIRIYGR